MALWLAFAAVLIATTAFVHARRAARKLAILEEQYWQLKFEHGELKARVEALPNGVAGEHGCADASLYGRFRAAGLDDVHMFPQLAAEAEAARLHAVQQRILASLSAAEAEEWRAAVNQAEAAGTFCIALPYHCAVGTKPS